MKLNQKILAVVILVTGIIIWNSISQKGLSDLAGDFEEVSSYRNENNTGPIRRVYVVTVSDTLWNDMEAYGNFQLHTKLGNTKVFFFLKDKPYPVRVEGGDPYFNPIYNPNCIGFYEKNASGLVSFRRSPFGSVNPD